MAIPRWLRMLCLALCLLLAAQSADAQVFKPRKGTPTAKVGPAQKKATPAKKTTRTAGAAPKKKKKHAPRKTDEDEDTVTVEDDEDDVKVTDE